MVNWIKFIAIGLIFVLSLFSFRLALQSVDSSSRRGGLYIGLIIVISVAILSLFQSLFPTSLKLVSEEGEVAEAHSLATLKTDSRLNGNAALSFGYLTEEDEYVLILAACKYSRVRKIKILKGDRRRSLFLFRLFLILDGRTTVS